MIKRGLWFSAGAIGGMVAGAGVTVYSYVRLREARGALAPDRVAETLVSSARVVGRSASVIGGSAVSAGSAVRITVREAVAEGRAAVTEAEARIIADLDRSSVGDPAASTGLPERAGHGEGFGGRGPRVRHGRAGGRTEEGGMTRGQ